MAIEQKTIEEASSIQPAAKPGRQLTRREFFGEIADRGKKGAIITVTAYLAWEAFRQGLVNQIIDAATSLRGGDNVSQQMEKSAYLLPTSPEAEIRRLASIPKAWLIPAGFATLVSLKLQERARAATPKSFSFAYQDNQKDTVGRTTLFNTERSVNNRYYDIGFGWWFDEQSKTIDEVTSASITGIFKGWVRPPGVKPEDPDLYMLMGNPLVAKDEWLVRIGNSKIGSGAVWVVDNLDIGGDPVPLEAYGTLKSFLSNQQFGNTPSIRINNAAQLDKAIQPGDVIKVMMSTVHRYRDENDVVMANIVYLRRFGGIGQIQQEIQ